MKLFFSWRPKLRLKFISIFLGLTIIPLVFAMTITILRIQNIQRESVVLLNKQIADTAATTVENFVVAQFRILQDIGAVQREFLGDPQFQDKILERFLFQNDDFVEISIVDWNGKETSRKHRLHVFDPENFRNRAKTKEFLQTKEDLFYISPVYISSGRPFFDIGVALVEPEGVFEGVIFAQIDARLMQDVVKDISNRVLQGKGRAYIVEGKGTVIAHPDPSAVLRETTFASFLAVQAMIQDLQVSSIESYENEQQEQVIGNGRPIAFTFSQERTFSPGWFVVVEQPTFIALAAVNGITQFSFIVLGLVLLLSIVTALFIAHSLTEPIRELQKGTQQIGLGNLDYSFHINTNDELQDLANEFRHMSKNLKDARERDQEVSRMKSEFLSIAAHQLRTPLSALKWVLYLVLEGDVGKLKKAQKELLEKGYKSNERMIALVNDLLDVVRIEEGRFDYKFEKSSVVPIVESVVKEIKVVADQKEVQVVLRKPSSKIPEVALDVLKFRLAVTNIIDNAVQYTPAKGKVGVEISYEKEILVMVRDTGVGIPKEQLGRIFSKFFRADNAVRMQTVGSGLGLFIAKNIIEKHGGKIWIESIEGKGTTVYFTIPVSRIG